MSKQTRRIRDKIWIWFAPPEWRPADLGGVVSVPEITQADQHKYRVTPPLSVSMYTVLSFTLMLAAGAYLLSIEATLRPVYHVLYLAELMLGLLTISALGEGKPWPKASSFSALRVCWPQFPLVPPRSNSHPCGNHDPCRRLFPARGPPVPKARAVQLT